MFFRIPQFLAYLGSFHNSISRLAAPVQYPDRQLPQLDISFSCSSSFSIQLGSFLNFISRFVAPVQYLARQLPQLDIQVSCFSLVSPSTAILAAALAVYRVSTTLAAPTLQDSSTAFQLLPLLSELLSESLLLWLLMHSKMLLLYFSCSSINGAAPGVLPIWLLLQSKMLLIAQILPLQSQLLPYY